MHPYVKFDPHRQTSIGWGRGQGGIFVWVSSTNSDWTKNHNKVNKGCRYCPGGEGEKSRGKTHLRGVVVAAVAAVAVAVAVAVVVAAAAGDERDAKLRISKQEFPPSFGSQNWKRLFLLFVLKLHQIEEAFLRLQMYKIDFFQTKAFITQLKISSYRYTLHFWSSMA